MRLALLLSLIGSCAHAQDGSSLDLLHKVAATYSRLNTFHVESIATVHYGGGRPTDLSVPVSLAFIRPGKFRIETRHPAIGMLLIGNSGSIIEYRGWENEFSRSSGILSASFSPDAMRGGGIGEMLYDTIATGVTSTKWSGRDELMLDGQAHKCAVLDVRYGGGGSNNEARFTFWIDERARTVLKRVFRGFRDDGRPQMTSSSVTSLRTDESLPAELFLFAPPPGAREVPSISEPRIASRERPLSHPSARHLQPLFRFTNGGSSCGTGNNYQ